MSQKPRRIALHIDQIITDRPCLDRTALESALRQKVEQSLLAQSLRPETAHSSPERLQVNVQAGKSTLHQRIASAVIKGMTE